MTGAAGIGLALGSGAARGLGHIAVLEVMDELGLRPTMIAGTSMGAVIGAAYAAGFPGEALRAHVLTLLSDPLKLAPKLLGARVGGIGQLFTALANPVLVDGEALLKAFWPPGMPETFDGLLIPFKAVASDVRSREEVVIGDGNLFSAVAASMAIPGIVRPVVREDRLLVDGVAVNPVPVEPLRAGCGKVIAVEVNATADQVFPADGEAAANTFDALLSGFSIMEHSLMRERLSRHRPDVLLAPPVGRFRPFDFLIAADVLAAADKGKPAARRALRRMMAEPYR